MKIASEKVQVLIDGVQMEKSRLGACYRAIQQKALSGHSGAMKLHETIREAFGAMSESEPLIICLANERERDI